MQAPAYDVTDAELGVLEVLWEHAPATIRMIRDTLYPSGGVSKSATVLKLLERLEGKGLVGRERSGAVQEFHVLVDRDALIGSQLRRIAQRLGGNSLTPLIVHLVQSASLTDRERARLREMLDAGPAAASSGKTGSRPSKRSRKESR